jgi:hypothetical protein
MIRSDTLIKVIDSVMGSNKTNWAIQYMNDNPHKKFMYITPYNKELSERVIPQCPNLKFRFAKEGQKFADFKDSLIKGHNIVATHECFKRADTEVEALLETSGYTLILDEVFDVVIDIKLVKADVDLILNSLATIEDNYLVWTDETYPDEKGEFSNIKQMAKLRKILVFDDSFFLWLFPIELFQKFSEVYIMTYLFPAQVQKHYFDLHGIQYEYYKVSEPTPQHYKLVPHDGIINNDFKALIDIYDGDLNDIGKISNGLTKTWYDKPTNKLNLARLKNNIRNFFRDIHNAKSKEIIWTTYKGYKEKLKGDGYASSFVECNCRATNAYGDRTYAAYCVNLHMRPMIKRYVDINTEQEQLWALSEMLQWVWRSAIRNGKKITLYVPSKRMRELLIQWLGNEIWLDYSIGK